jgi:UDP-N-acetylglucosamine:LPS N-acetylglucosamine transferase
MELHVDTAALSRTAYPESRPPADLQLAPSRVLLMTSGLGVGHVRAAQAVATSLESHGVTVRMLDLWSLMNPGVAGACHQTYLTLVQHHPDLYERLYRLDEGTWRQILESENGPPRAVLQVLDLISALAADAAAVMPRGGPYGSDRLLLSLWRTALPYEPGSLAGNGVRARLAIIKWTWQRLTRRLESAIRDFAPDAIVSTQMIPAAMTSYLKGKGRLGTPVVGVITDFGDHDFWRQRGVNHYCVAHASIAARMRERYGHAGIATTGVPLMPHFEYPVPQPQARRQLGLPQDAPIVLVLGGGLGLSVDVAASRLLERHGTLSVVAMPGKNSSAQAALSSLALKHPGRVHVFPWTERMDMFVRAADVVVSKPGGVTVAEALACGRPLLATRSLGGQEGVNVSFLTHHDVGGLVADDEVLPRVERLLADPEMLRQMQQRAWSLGRRDGARRVTDLVLELVSLQRSHRIAGRLR